MNLRFVSRFSYFLLLFFIVKQKSNQALINKNLQNFLKVEATKSRPTSSIKNTTSQQTDLPEVYQFVKTINSIKNILSSYIIQFYRVIIQHMEYWNIPVPVLFKSITS